MKENKLSKLFKFSFFALMVIFGTILWFKRDKKPDNGHSARFDNKEKFSNETVRTRDWLNSIYWILFIIIFIVIVFGVFIYVVSLYPIPISDNLTSTGNLQLLISENQSLTGTFQIQNADNQSNIGNVGNGFDLAIISGLLGGFALTLVAIKRGPKFLHMSLILQGVFYVLATVSFIVFGFYLAGDKIKMLETSNIFLTIYVVSFYTGAISLAIGISFTLWSLIRLVILNRKNLLKLLDQAISGD